MRPTLILEGTLSLKSADLGVTTVTKCRPSDSQITVGLNSGYSKLSAGYAFFFSAIALTTVCHASLSCSSGYSCHTWFNIQPPAQNLTMPTYSLSGACACRPAAWPLPGSPPLPGASVLCGMLGFPEDPL